MCLRRANEKKSGGEAFHCAQPKPHCKTEITDLKVGHYKSYRADERERLLPAFPPVQTPELPQRLRMKRKAAASRRTPK